MTEDTDADPRLRADVHADVALYGTADGRAIAIATLEDKFWQTFVSKMSSRFPQLANSVWADRSGRTRDKLRLAAVLREVFQQMTLEEIERCLPADELCWTPVLRGTELLRDPQLVARKLVMNTPWGKEPSSPFAINGRRAPVESPVAELGRDTAALWGKFGMSGPSP
jgi:crotonobetainyl-CoA:carnitine CoA-transferase CaiB-like acyl-CoA transferase